MLRKVTITAYGNAFIQDKAGLEAVNDGQEFTSLNLKSGDTKTVTLTEGQWDRVRPQLVRLSQMRLAVAGTPAGKPAVSYTVEYLPGARPRLTQLEGSLDINTAGAQAIVLKGSNLITGVAATGALGAGTSLLSLVSTRKGAIGNKVVVDVRAATGAGSVTTTHGYDGLVTIVVVPAAAGPGAIAIAAQIAASSHAAEHVVGTGAGTGTVAAGKVTLSGGDGSGMAWLEVDCASSSRLLLNARKVGNAGNLISLVLSTPSGAGSVTVSGNKITVVPAAAGTAANTVAAQINANASAAALVLASNSGTGAVVVQTERFLYGGSGEDLVATVGGAAAAITSHTDTTLTLSVTGAAAVTAGVAAGEQAIVQVLTGYGTIQAQLTAVAI